MGLVLRGVALENSRLGVDHYKFVDYEYKEWLYGTKDELIKELLKFKCIVSFVLSIFDSPSGKFRLPPCVIALKISEQVERCFYLRRSLDKNWEHFVIFNWVLNLLRDSLVLICDWFGKLTLATFPSNQNQTKTCCDLITHVFLRFWSFTLSSHWLPRVPASSFVLIGCDDCYEFSFMTHNNETRSVGSIVNPGVVIHNYD